MIPGLPLPPAGVRGRALFLNHALLSVEVEWQRPHGLIIDGIDMYYVMLNISFEATDSIHINNEQQTNDTSILYEANITQIELCSILSIMVTVSALNKVGKGEGSIQEILPDDGLCISSSVPELSPSLALLLVTVSFVPPTVEDSEVGSRNKSDILIYGKT